MTARRAVMTALFVLSGAFGGFLFVVLLAKTSGQDWMVFDTAARAALRGDTALLLDGVRLTQVLNDTHPTLAQKLVFHPWVYPPPTLLLVLPFGLLPWAMSYGGFQVLSFAAMAFALKGWIADRRRFLIVLSGTLLCPASIYTIGAGQNSFLSAALFLGGARLLDTRPFAGGLILGVLAYKPQLALMVPVALLAARAWRAVAGAACMVAALVAVSLAMPGIEVWRGWLHLFLARGDAPRSWVELYGQSVFTVLQLAQAPPVVANAGQGAALLIGAAATWFAFRGNASPLAKLLVLLCATGFSAPHFGDYDAVLLVLCALLLMQTEAGKSRWALVCCLVWCSTAINPPYLFANRIPALFYVSELTPLIVLTLLIGTVVYARTAGPGLQATFARH